MGLLKFFARKRDSNKSSVIPTPINLGSGNPYPNASITDIQQIFQASIKQLFASLPIPSTEAEQLLLPSIINVIHLIHLLPGSESHHHAHQGGLLQHTLESATAAARVAMTLNFPSLHFDDDYKNRDRWIVGASVCLLIHDLGKIADVIISDDCGQHWNPETLCLSDWLAKRTNYYVSWKSERQSHQHELRAIRYAYKFVLTESLTRYLGEISGNVILDAIEEAIVLSKGPLHSVLVHAEAFSIEQDLKQRRISSSNFPVAQEIISSIASNISQGLWSINQPQSKVFLTQEGLFIRADPDIGADIRSQALSRGNSFVPKSIEAINTLLLEAGFSDPPVKECATESNLWKIWCLPTGNTPLYCLKISAHVPQPDLLLKTTKVIALVSSDIPADISEVWIRQWQSLPKPPTSNQKSEVHTRVKPLPTEPVEGNQQAQDFRAPTGKFLDASDQKICLTELELKESRDKPFNPTECRNFLFKLANTIANIAMKAQQHELLPILPSLNQATDTRRVFRSQEVEKLLARKKIDPQTCSTLFKMRKNQPTVMFDTKNHKIIVFSEVPHAASSSHP